MHMLVRMCQCLQLYVCNERKQYGEMNEVCVMTCCSAMFISLQRVWVCVCLSVCPGVFALLKHKFLGNSRRYGKCSLHSFWGLVVNIVSITSLTVTHETDADTVEDYPTFVWLHRLIDHISHFSTASAESDINFGDCMFCGENMLFRGRVRANTSFPNVLTVVHWRARTPYICCVWAIFSNIRAMYSTLAAACVWFSNSRRYLTAVWIQNALNKRIFYLLIYHPTPILLPVLSHAIIKWLFFSGLLR